MEIDRLQDHMVSYATVLSLGYRTDDIYVGVHLCSQTRCARYLRDECNHSTTETYGPHRLHMNDIADPDLPQLFIQRMIN